MTKEELYSKLYRIAGHILRETNPCQIQKDVEGRVSCLASRKPHSQMTAALCCGSYYPNENKPRANVCKHWRKDRGCTTDALGCKVFLCGIAADKFPDVQDALYILRQVAYNAPIPVPCYLSKDEAFAQAATYAIR